MKHILSSLEKRPGRAGLNLEFCLKRSVLDHGGAGRARPSPPTFCFPCGPQPTHDKYCACVCGLSSLHIQVLLTAYADSFAWA